MVICTKMYAIEDVIENIFFIIEVLVFDALFLYRV